MITLKILGLLFASVTALAATSISIGTTGGNVSSPILYGYMFEDINNSGDGGLYAELLQNRAFQKVDVSNQTAALYAWEAVGNATISAVNSTTPVSSSLPNSLKIVSGGAKGGVANTGYWGIKVLSSWTYKVTLWAKSTGETVFLDVSLVSVTLGNTFATKAIEVSSTSWTEYTFTLKPESDAIDFQNFFEITFDGVAGDTVYLAALSLFPPTFKNRENGMRIDIAETIYATKPSFFRFPGGNNLEGQTFDTRWKWNETLGPINDRPGRVGDWSYINTDGLGLMEYLHWLEDLEVMGIMAVWSGYSLDGLSVPEDEMGPYVQEALDQIEFVIGDAANSSIAAKRAALGHPAPYNLTYIEIGNEDFFANATYVYRWKLLVTAIAEKYPHLKLLSTDLNGDDGEQNLIPAPQYSDRHHYDVPGYFLEQFTEYDNAPRPPLGPLIFEGEYAVINNLSYPNYNLWNSSAGRLNYSDAEAAVSEAVFMIGLERNSDLVFSASYAPMLQNINNYQWTPNLILFDAGSVYPSASYEVQKVFSVNRGDYILPINVTGPEAFTSLFAVASSVASEGIVYLKLSNPSGNTTALSVTIPSVEISKGEVTVLTAPNYWDNNQPGITPTFIPQNNSLATGKTSFTYTVPAWAVVVFTLWVDGL